ncbi:MULTISPECIES: CBO0543 family protein [unclassified Oceanobacillus]|uniref:CBO0543 family protein n=1 Tax=unclassified Oceanobacillus TaxID=2630292 RepID=UPI003FA5559C
MSIVKHWRKSNSPSSQKKPFYQRNLRLKSYLSTAILVSLIGTYLDLLLVGAGLYFFPKRLFSEIFTINILFTICILPLCTFIIIFILKRIHPLLRYFFLFICSLFAYIAEQTAEQFGLFIHSPDWKHEFSLIGYFLFLIVIWRFYCWLEKGEREGYSKM